MKRNFSWIIPIGLVLGMLVPVLVGLRPTERVVAQNLPATAASTAPIGAISESDPFIGWQLDEVARSELISSKICLKVDAAGHIHMAYGESHLYYANYDGNNWQYQVVDSPDFVADLSLALDADQHPHISYITGEGQIKYATWTGAEWLSEVVEDIGYFSTRTSLVLDSNGYAHIAYEAGSEIVYTHWTGSTWVREIADSSPYLENTLHSISLTLDPAGNPGLIYEYLAGVVRYSHRSGGVWQSQEVTLNAFYPSLVFDAAGTPHISYVLNSYQQQQSFLLYATWNGTGWDEQELVAVNDSSLEAGPLVLDSGENPHIAYLERDNPFTRSRLHHIYWSGAGWSNESPGDNPNYLYSPILDLDAAGNPHIGYSEEAPVTYLKKARYTYKSGTGWVNYDVDGARLLGSASALTLDSNQQPHAAFFQDGQLIYTRWTGTQWEHQPLFTPLPVFGQQIALALDPWDRPHMAYGQEGLDLKYLTWDGSQWLNETVPMTSSYRFSLALDPQGHPHLCSGDLYAYKDVGGWHIQTLPGENCSVAVDTTGKPHIASYGGWGVGLQYLHWDGTTWLTEVVDSAASSDAVAIQVGPDGLPQIAYTLENQTIKYARSDGTAWQFSTVSEDDYDDDTNISLALNPAGEPSLLFQKYSGYRFFARLSGADWLAVQVGEEYQWPSINSLAVDAAGRPHVLGNICGGAYNTETCFGSCLIHWVGRGADFTAAPLDGYFPLSVAFSNTSFGDFNTFAWDFGDGATSTAENPVHVYAAPGVYSPTLTVSGPDGTYTLSKPEYINARVLTDFRADFTHGYAPFEVAFTNLSHGDFTTVLWDFGDGITSTLPAPTHTYTVQGVYTVSLTVSGPSGSYQRLKPGYVTTLETVETLLEPGQTAVLSYTTLAGTVTTLEFSTDTVTRTTNLLYRPLFSVTYPITSELGYAGQAFELEASVDDVLLEHLVFGSPVTTTIEYLERVNEETIALHTWDGHTWQEAACGAYERNPDENWLSFSICHTGRFALVAQPVRIYFPLIGIFHTHP